MPKFKVDDILEVLDGERDESRFPVLGMNQVMSACFVGIRLHLFASRDSWLIAFDRLANFSPNWQYWTFTDGFSANESLTGVDQPIEVLMADGSWSWDVWREGGCAMDPLDFTIRIHGNSVRTFSFTNEDYLNIGVDLANPDPELKNNQGANLAAHILRLIDREVGDEIYATPAAILDILKPADKKLQHLLTLKEYFLPPYSGPLPSETETFQMIADVLVHRDPSRYHPREEPNTRFSDWPFSGRPY